MVDLSGDGLEFVSVVPDQSENAVGIAAGYDITGDGEVKELVGLTARAER